MDTENLELKKAFAAALEAEAELAQQESEAKEAKSALDKWIREGKQKHDAAIAECAEIMRRDGLVEETIIGKYGNYKLSFSTPRRSVDVVDDCAVPDEFVRLERKPMKKEINDAFKDAETLPNWLQFKEGESKLQYRMVKK